MCELYAFLYHVLRTCAVSNFKITNMFEDKLEI